MGNYNRKNDLDNTFYVGMDVHKNSISLVTYHLPQNKFFGETKIATDYKLVLSYIEELDNMTGNCATIICGYEAGVLGFALQRSLASHGAECIILAPTTMLVSRTRTKTDKRDARLIAQCLATGGYKPVHIPTEEDEELKNYIRMRDDHKIMLKKIKQQILSFCLKNGYEYSGKGRWNTAHLSWLNSLQPRGIDAITLQGYMSTYYTLCNLVDNFNKQIEKFAEDPKYKDSVDKLCCLIGIKVHTAVSIIAEVSDFSRFDNARNFAAFLGLCPGESSSGDSQHRLSITKAGNSHVRLLLVEAAQSISRGKVGYIGKELKMRQDKASKEVVDYANLANVRLRRKYKNMVLNSGKHTNVAKTAIARELACFIWGMMTNHMELKIKVTR